MTQEKPKDEAQSDLEAALERVAIAPPPEDAEIAADDIGATALAENVGKEEGDDEEASPSVKP